MDVVLFQLVASGRSSARLLPKSDIKLHVELKMVLGGNDSLSKVSEGISWLRYKSTDAAWNWRLSC